MLPLMSQIPCNLRYPIHNALRGIEEDGEESAKVEKFFLDDSRWSLAGMSYGFCLSLQLVMNVSID
jgi:hypothetical protein